MMIVWETSGIQMDSRTFYLLLDQIKVFFSKLHLEFGHKKLILDSYWGLESIVTDVNHQEAL